MKKTLLLSLLFFSLRLTANQVSFCVDMRYFQPIDIGGINLYIEGDTVFHPMSQVANDTNIYCVTLDLPADSCVQYAFLNGSDFYGLEFVPLESRVSDFNSDRWVCIDGPTADTLHLVPVLFSSNAPEGQRLVRYKVDLSASSVSPNGIHVAGSFQGWDPSANRMHNLNSLVYEALTYVSPGTYSYLFYNGNTIADAEIVPGICSVNSYREVSVVNDTVVQTVCYASCTPCITGIFSPMEENSFTVYPNPTIDYFQIKTTLNNLGSLRLYDITGKLVATYAVSPTYSIQDLPPGTYHVQVMDAQGKPGATTAITIR